MGYALQLVRGPDPEQCFDLPDEGAVTIGRAPDAEVRLNDQRISRQHCRITVRLPSLTLVDLQSPNGTFLNGEQVSLPEQLMEGDEIHLGDSVFTIMRAEGDEQEEAGFCLTCHHPAIRSCERCGPQFVLSVDGIPGLRLEKRLGTGHRGTVYRARRMLDGESVAVKLLPLIGKAGDLQLRRFMREAKIPAKLKHENAVAIFDCGVLKSLRPGEKETLMPRAAFIVQEYVEGRSLRAVVVDDGPLEVARAVEVAAQVADLLVHAAEEGIVHREIKPENLMVTLDGMVKLTDFGLAKSIEDTGLSGLTVTGKAYGTPAYMAPEQAVDAKHVSQQSDIYSLGATLFMLISGQAPFTGKSLSQILVQVLNEPPPKLRKSAKGVSRALSKLVDRCLAKLPEDRPQSAETLRDELRKIHGSLS